MKISKIMTILSCILLLISLPTCKQSPHDKEIIITVKDIWFSEQIDNDGDGYYCDANLYFSLSSNKKAEIFVELEIRSTSSNQNDPYQTCFQSTSFSIDENNAEDWCISMHSINVAINEGYYDFKLKIYLSSKPDDPLSVASSSNYSDLGHFPLEPVTNDPIEQWMSWIDDGLFESAFTYYPRYPTGASYTKLAEKFEKPSTADNITLKKIRVHIPSLYITSPSITFTIYTNQNNQPFMVLNENNYNLYSAGWNEFEFENDLTSQNVFYIGVATSDKYAVSIDSNSVTKNGYALWYSTGIPPTYTWQPQQRNFAIEIFVSYSLNLNLSMMNRDEQTSAEGNHIKPNNLINRKFTDTGSWSTSK